MTPPKQNRLGWATRKRVGKDHRLIIGTSGDRVVGSSGIETPARRRRGTTELRSDGPAAAVTSAAAVLPGAEDLVPSRQAPHVYGMVTVRLYVVPVKTPLPYIVILLLNPSLFEAKCA